jgi:hypothetical protein
MLDDVSPRPEPHTPCRKIGNDHEVAKQADAHIGRNARIFGYLRPYIPECYSSDGQLWHI